MAGRGKHGQAQLAVSSLILLAGLNGCVASSELAIRGELDRTRWQVRTCDTRETYRVVLASSQVLSFDHTLTRLHVGPADPIVVDFRGVRFDPLLPWESADTVGVASDVAVTRGTCGSAVVPVTP